MLSGPVARVVASLALGGLAGAGGCGSPAGAARDADVPDTRLAPRDAGPDPIDASPYDAAPGPDLQFVAAEMVHSVVVTSDVFQAGDCEVLEGCVGAEGRRTLVRFDTVSANTGQENVFVGVPPDAGVSNEMFEWSACHKHHHVKNYASYELLDANGVVLTARKQAFCLEDGEQIRPGIPATGYSCANQGITRGWADVYSRYLPCQWIDVTGVPSGQYTVRIVVNPLHILTEANYANNEFTVGVQF